MVEISVRRGRAAAWRVAIGAAKSPVAVGQKRCAGPIFCVAATIRVKGTSRSPGTVTSSSAVSASTVRADASGTPEAYEVAGFLQAPPVPRLLLP
ncbi:MAG: hypothetical protein QOI83_3121, partial [Streptomycetaceae bacterium]|nr:hypothetical protein [Streptomycetaceae bacterium]